MGNEPQGTALLAAALGSGIEEAAGLSFRQQAVLRRVLACGTGELGCHLYRCAQCGETHAVAHSCRDRHCPRCQRTQAERWLDRQRDSLLPVPYFHVVFTLPHQLNDLIAQNPKRCLNLLFDAAGSTVMDFGRNNLGVQLGMTAVLHTWGQTLTRHYHLHLIVTGGGMSESGDQWIGASRGKWLFSNRALGEVYRARYLAGLEKLYEDGQLEFHGKLRDWCEKPAFFRQLRTCSRRRWNVYAKAPFAGPSQVLGYLSRYTHRVAISGSRMVRLDLEAKTVTFRYRDYRQSDRRWREMTLSSGEFTRRFAAHILPKGFCKIRHYGILSNGNRRHRVSLARYYLTGSGWPEAGRPVDDPAEESSGRLAESGGQGGPARKCPKCGSDQIELIAVINASAERGQSAGQSCRGRSPPQPAGAQPPGIKP